MAENDVVESHAAPIVAVRACRTHSPQWSRYELGLHRAIPIAFVKVHTDVVAFQISEDVAHQERIAGRLFETRQPRAIIDYLDERGCGREKIVEDSVDGIIDSCLLYTSDAADERSSVDLGG